MHKREEKKTNEESQELENLPQQKIACPPPQKIFILPEKKRESRHAKFALKMHVKLQGELYNI